MNKSAIFYLLYNLRNTRKTQISSTYVDSILYKKRTFLAFILSQHDVIAPIVRQYYMDNGLCYIINSNISIFPILKIFLI